MNAKLNTETPQSFISNGSNTSFSAEEQAHHLTVIHAF